MITSAKDLKTRNPNKSRAKLMEISFETLRQALGIHRVTTKFDVLMHATFELALVHGVDTRLQYERNNTHTRSTSQSKLKFAFDEVEFVTSRVEDKIGLLDRRTKVTQIDLILKAALMLVSDSVEKWEKYPFYTKISSMATSKCTTSTTDSFVPNPGRISPCLSDGSNSSGYQSDNYYTASPVTLPPITVFGYPFNISSTINLSIFQ